MSGYILGVGLLGYRVILFLVFSGSSILFCIFIYLYTNFIYQGFAGGSEVKVSARSAGDPDDSWVRKIPWRRKWQPTLVFLPGESHGWRSLAGYSLQGHKESDMTEWLHFHFSLSYQLSYILAYHTYIPIYIPTNSARRFPLFYSLYSICCL